MPAISCCDHVFCTSSTIKCAKNEENQLCHLLPLDKTRNYNVSSRYATPSVHNIRSPYDFIVFFCWHGIAFAVETVKGNFVKQLITFETLQI